MQTLFMVFTYRVSWNFFFFFTKHDRILQDPSHLNSIRPYRGFTHFYPGLRSPFLFRVSDYKAASLKKKIFRRPFFSISFRCGFHFSSEFGVGTESLLDYCFFLFVCFFGSSDYCKDPHRAWPNFARALARNLGEKKNETKNLSIVRAWRHQVTSSLTSLVVGGLGSTPVRAERITNRPVRSSSWRYGDERTKKKKKERCGDPSRRNAAFYLSRFRVLLCVCVCVCVCSFVFLCSTTSN